MSKEDKVVTDDNNNGDRQEGDGETFNDEKRREVSEHFGVNRVLDHLRESKGLKLPEGSDRAACVKTIIARLKEKFSTRVSDRGWLIIAEREGKPADLVAEVENMLTLGDAMGDPDTVSRAILNGSVKILAKADLKTAKAKADFISKYGYEAFVSLPLTRSAPINMDPAQMTSEQYRRLPLATKAKFIGKIGYDKVLEILARK